MIPAALGGLDFGSLKYFFQFLYCLRPQWEISVNFRFVPGKLDSVVLKNSMSCNFYTKCL
jgi:hypothetical protein